jgi:hypothetical protein
VIDVSGAGDFVLKVDINGKRSAQESLGSFTMETAAITIARHGCPTQNFCPKVLLMGLDVDNRKEHRLAFGDYCEVFDGLDNMARTVPMH